MIAIVISGQCVSQNGLVPAPVATNQCTALVFRFVIEDSDNQMSKTIGTGTKKCNTSNLAILLL